MSNPAPTLSATLYLTHCHTLLKWRQTEQQQKKNGSKVQCCFLFHPRQQHPSLRESEPTEGAARLWQLRYGPPPLMWGAAVQLQKFPPAGIIERPIWRRVSAIQDNVSGFPPLGCWQHWQPRTALPYRLPTNPEAPFISYLPHTGGLQGFRCRRWIDGRTERKPTVTLLGWSGSTEVTLMGRN